MDGIVGQIYEAMLVKEHLKSTLLVLCGDHGMNDAGNHGGSAPGETSPALVFISPKLKGVVLENDAPAPFQNNFQYYSTIEQSDVAPTLAALLGFPIPRNSLGVFISEFLPFWPKSKTVPLITAYLLTGPGNDQNQILLRNARQILSVITATFPSFENDRPSQNCQESLNSVSVLACEWKAIMTSLPEPEIEGQDCEAWRLAVIKVNPSA